MANGGGGRESWGELSSGGGRTEWGKMGGGNCPAQKKSAQKLKKGARKKVGKARNWRADRDSEKKRKIVFQRVSTLSLG